MRRGEKDVVLNRAVFTQTRFESSALTVLTTLFHRFDEAGHYQVQIRHQSRPLREMVVAVLPDAGKHQENVDLADDPYSHRGCCDDDSGIEIAVGGVVGFYPSTGVGGYQVSIAKVPASASGLEMARDRKGADEDTAPESDRLVLDNDKQVPAGDLFSVVLARPGRYVISVPNASADVVVSLPKRERLRTDQPSLMTLTAGGFEPAKLELLAGRALVVLCEVSATVKVELVESEGREEDDGPRKYTYRKVGAKQT